MEATIANRFKVQLKHFFLRDNFISSLKSPNVF